MKINKFDVVELKDKKRATILDIIKNKNQFIAEVVNAYGITLGKKVIATSDINRVVYSKSIVR